MKSNKAIPGRFLYWLFINLTDALATFPTLQATTGYQELFCHACFFFAKKIGILRRMTKILGWEFGKMAQWHAWKEGGQRGAKAPFWARLPEWP
jgi:hypothetical protein